MAAFLADRGLDVVGVDLSPGMLAQGRRAHAAIPFVAGRLASLPLADGCLAGAVCWYSIIHSPPAALGGVGAELARVLVPGGHLVVAFQAGVDEEVRRHDAHGTGVTLVSHRHAPAAVAACLERAGLVVGVRALREPELAHESAPQAFLFARRT